MVQGIGGIVVDAVGTLIEPAPPVAMAYAEAAHRQGLELDPVLIKGRFLQEFGADERDEVRGPLASDEAIERRRWRRIVGQVLPELSDPDRAFAELWDHFARGDSWRVIPDAVPALRRLGSAGFGIRIASNFDGRLRSVLDGLPVLAPWRTGLVISSEVGHRKPHPDFYRAACDRLGLAPDRVLCVGDDPENDVRGPIRAGLRAALIDRKGEYSNDLPHFASLGDLADALLGPGPDPTRSDNRTEAADRPEPIPGEERDRDSP